MKISNIFGIRWRLAGAGLTVLALSTVMAGGGARAETLADALAAAYENSGLIEQNRAVLRAADEDVAQAVSALRPVLSYIQQTTYDLSENTVNAAGFPGGDDFSDRLSTTFALSADLLIFDFGATRLAVDSAKELVLATRQQLVDIEQQVLFRAVDAYMEVRRQANFVALRQNNVRLISQELRAAEDRFEVGEVTRTDVALAEAALAEARSLLATAQGNLTIANAEFRAVVGRPPGDLEDPSTAPGLPAEERAAILLARRIAPSIRQVEHQVAAAELNVARARAAMQPSITLNGQVALDEELFGGEQVGIDVQAPIYQGGRLTAQIRSAMASRDQQRASLYTTRQNVDQGVSTAYASLMIARSSIAATGEQIRAARTAFEGIREEATLGARTTLDVLDAEQDLRDAQTQQISAQADEIVASYSILQATGLLTVDHLGLGVRTYDPAAYYNLVDDAPAIVSPRGQALDRVLRAIGKE